MHRMIFIAQRLVAQVLRPATSVFSAFYAGAAFFILHRMILEYVHSSFLSQFLGEQYLGLVFSLAAVISIGTFFLFTRLMYRFGVNRFFIGVTILQLCATAGLAFVSEYYVILFLFIVSITLSQIIFYTFDVFIEMYSRSEEETGRVRGMYLTILTVSSVSASLLLGLLVGTNEYWKAYVAGALFLLPMLYLVGSATRTVPFFSTPSRQPFLPTLFCVIKNKNLSIILFLHFLLQLSFVWLVIYIPLYLTQTIGFSWIQFGSLLAIGLMGYVVIEYPAGWLADTYLGEKELLVLGFIILSLSFMSMSLVTTSIIIVWAIIFFMSRIGAGLVEIMSETFFFKKVDGNDTNTIALFRMLRPLATIIGPLFASVVLLYYPFQYLFLACGIVLLVLSVVSIVFLEDTR